MVGCSFFHPAIFNPIYGGEKAAERNEYNINNGKVIAHSVGATFSEMWLKIFVFIHSTTGTVVVVSAASVVVFDSTGLFTQNEN